MLSRVKRVSEGDNLYAASSAIFGLDRSIEDGNLRWLYDRWQAIYLGRDHVGIEDIDPLELSERGLMGYVHLVDVRPDRPDGFVFEAYGRAVPLGGGRDFTGRPVVSHPLARFGEEFAREYWEIKHLGVPAFSDCVRVFDSSRLDYQRLVLPLSRRDAPVDRLLVAVQFPGTELLPHLL